MVPRHVSLAHLPLPPCPPAPSPLSRASHSIRRSESPIRQRDQFRHVLQRLNCQFHYCSFQESLVERHIPPPFGGSPRAAGWLGDGIRSSRRRPTGGRPCRRQPRRSWRRWKSARPGPPSTGGVRERQHPHRRSGHPFDFFTATGPPAPSASISSWDGRGSSRFSPTHPPSGACAAATF